MTPRSRMERSRRASLGGVLALVALLAAPLGSTATALEMTVYPFTTDCTSMSEVSSQPINQCTQDESGTYFENICNNGAAATAALESKGLIVKRR